MDKKLKAKWIKALRSGQYKQGTGYLCRADLDTPKAFCCLGVLFDIQGAEWVDDNDGHYSRSCKFDGEAYRANSLKSELHRAFPYLAENIISKLMNMNDGAHNHKQHNFKQIADYIKKNL